jgi:tetratricopeptide (TPR) repeat protein
MQSRGRMTREERESYLLARQRFETGDDRGALETFTLLLESRPRFADVHYMVGLVHERGGDLEAASTSLELALEINPSYAEAVAALVSVYERRGLFERSRELAAQLSPQAGSEAGNLDATTRGKLANLHAVLGDAYREAGELREAIEAYRKALDRCPAFHDIRHRLGIALREAGRPNNAIGEFKRVLRTHSDYLESAVQLGLTYYTLGRTPQALAEWESVLQRDPSREDAQMYLRMVHAGEIATEL